MWKLSHDYSKVNPNAHVFEMVNAGNGSKVSFVR
jgi:hypothetical protein